MMNDFDQVDSLQRKVSSLEEENAKLKHRIEELEQELALNGYVLDEEENVTVNNYYLKKYIEIHNDVYDERIKDLEDKRKNLQDEYDGIVEQEKGIETITIKNESLIKRIEEIDQIISDNYYNLEKEKFEFEAEVKEVTKKEILVYNSTITSIDEILDSLKRESLEIVTSKVDSLCVSLMNNLYPINKKLVMDKYNLVNKLDELNAKEQKVKMEAKNLSNEKKSLEGAIQTISLETVESLLDGIVLELSKVSKSKQELDELFKNLKEQNLKEIQDEIRHFKVLEYSNKEIAESMDKIIEEYRSKLRTMDTVTNIQLNKTMELSRLTAKKQELEVVKKEYDDKVSEYQNLVGINENISKNIEELEEYISLTNKAVQAKPEYLEFVNKYNGLIATIKIVNNEIKNTEEKIKDYKETRRVKALDPYAKASIQELTEKIKEAEGLLEKYASDIRNAETELSNITTLDRNLKLINVLKDKAMIETKLPDLYNKQRDLIDSVNRLYQEIKALEEKVKEYNEILDKIEELESEINNM